MSDFASFWHYPYKLENAPEVVALWNSTILGTTYPLSERLWRQQTEGDPDFEPTDGLLVRDSKDGKLIAFVMTKVWRGRAVSAELQPRMSGYEKRGWVIALAVAPEYQRQGLGSNLVRWAEDHFKAEGAVRSWIGASLRHFFPGPPTDIPGLDTFFGKLGYQFDPQLEYDLRGFLRDWVAPEPPPTVANGDYYFTQGQEGEQQAILDFLWRAFPGRWLYEAELYFKQDGAPQDITLLKSQEGTIEGYLMTYHPQSRILGPGIYWTALREPTYGGIGPLGVSKNVRGLGLGLAIVAAGAEYLQGKGITDCVIDWTTLVDFYGKLGFKPWKSYHKVFKDF